MKEKTYFTRRNLVVIALSFFCAVVVLFTGLCIEGSHSITNKNNPIALIAEKLNFPVVEPGISGFIGLILMAIYIVVLTASLIYEFRYAITNKQKPFSLKMIGVYLLTFISCTVLSVGIAIVIQSPISKENILKLLTFIGESLLLGIIIYAVIFIVIAFALMLVINFFNIDKPFKLFSDSDIPDIPDDDGVPSVVGNFDDDGSTTTNNNFGGANVEGGSGLVAGAGLNVVEQLDDREKVFPALSTIDVRYGGFAIESVPTDNISLEELCVQFRNFLAKEEKLYFELDTIRIFVSGFATSHFMILEGLSGTGKSSLPRYFAKFINAKVLFLPVQATWRDKSNILGYFNEFSKSYSETDFLAALYEANYNPDQINIFVLDEMNISRVEYYFADFLSVLEYPENEWRLRVMQLPYNFNPPIKLEDGYVTITNNSYFVGTANKDDSTFSIADKVYDRAITIDFDNRNIPFEVKGEASRINLSKTHLHNLYASALLVKENCMNDEDFKKFQTISDFIYKEFDVAFGNRILNQIEVIVPTFVACGGKKEDILDFLLTRKIIVKLEGRFEEYVKGALKRLLALINKTYGPNVFVRSEKEINSLIRKL